MQAIILAAGFGKRLKPITDRIPKCLVPINGKPLLINSLELLETRGIAEVVLVVSHMKGDIYQAVENKFGKMNIFYVENNLYDKTNNVYTLWLARDHMDKGSLLLECDLWYDGRILDTLKENLEDCNVLVSKYDPASMNGTVVALASNYRIKKLIIKRDQGTDFDYSDKYKTVNMYCFSKKFLTEYLVPYLDLYIKTHGVDSYYELVLGELIYLGKSKINAAIVNSDSWCEIDDEQDLRRAKNVKNTDWK